MCLCVCVSVCLCVCVFVRAFGRHRLIPALRVAVFACMHACVRACVCVFVGAFERHRLIPALRVAGLVMLAVWHDVLHMRVGGAGCHTCLGAAPGTHEGLVMYQAPDMCRIQEKAVGFAYIRQPWAPETHT